jgi:proteasome-associated ATPase
VLTPEEQQLFAALRDRLRQQDELLKAVTKPSSAYGTVVRVLKNGSLLAIVGGAPAEMECPPNLQTTLQPGDGILISRITGGIIDKASWSVPWGPVATFRSYQYEHTAEVEIGNTISLVFCSTPKIEEGCRVVLDSARLMILANLGKPANTLLLTNPAHVTWDDVGGLDEAKREMVDAIETPFKHPEIFKKYGRKPPKGILLYGPPGCGKTLLGKAVASALARIAGQNSEGGFIYVKGPELLEKYVGESERRIRELFAHARNHYKKNNFPAVVFIDEADAIVPKRGSRRSSDVDMTIVPMFLSEMDGMDNSGALMLFATNKPDALDPAITRDGRVDRKIRITRPDKQSAARIFAIHLRGKPTACDSDELAVQATEAFFRDTNVLGYVEGKKTQPFQLKHLASGAMISSVVQQAAARAMYRELEGGPSTGIDIQDMDGAIVSTMEQNRHLDHTEAMDEAYV